MLKMGGITGSSRNAPGIRGSALSVAKAVRDELPRHGVSDADKTLVWRVQANQASLSVEMGHAAALHQGYCILGGQIDGRQVRQHAIQRQQCTDSLCGGEWVECGGCDRGCEPETARS